MKIVRPYVQAGIMFVQCRECKDGTLRVSVPLKRYAQIRVFGDQTEFPMCPSCHARTQVILRSF